MLPLVTNINGAIVQRRRVTITTLQHLLALCGNKLNTPAPHPLVFKLNKLSSSLGRFPPDEDAPPHRGLNLQPPNNGFTGRARAVVLEAEGWGRRWVRREAVNIAEAGRCPAHVQNVQHLLHLIVLQYLVAPRPYLLHQVVIGTSAVLLQPRPVVERVES